MSLPQKHNFEMHICGFDFDVVNMEDNSFFLEDMFSTFDRDLKNKKIMVPMNPEGGARTAPRAPRLNRLSNRFDNRLYHVNGVILITTQGLSMLLPGTPYRRQRANVKEVTSLDSEVQW